MRPVEKGACPTTPDPSNPSLQIAKIFTDFHDAKKDLLERIGAFCSYCNARIPSCLAVEHVVPKKRVAYLALNWDNFLLACVNCNSRKLEKIEDVYQPDLHNTHLPFEYFDDGKVEISTQITDIDERQLAQNTLDLVELQLRPNTADAKDTRWKNRIESFAKANSFLHAYEQLGCPPILVTNIVDSAHSTGHFSIWYKVFEHHPDVLRALIDRFEGTAPDAFNVASQPIKRTPLM